MIIIGLHADNKLLKTIIVYSNNTIDIKNTYAL